MAEQAAESTETEKPPETAVTPESTVVEIPPDPPKEEPKPTRKERRESRAAGYDQEAREARQAADSARREAEEARRELAELRGRFSERQAGQPDPIEAKLQAVRARIENAVARMGQGDESARADWHAAEEERLELIADRRAKAVAKETEDRVTKAIPRQMDPREAALMAEFPDLEDPQFRAVAEAEVVKLVRDRRDMSDPRVRFATLREGAARAARDLGIGGHERKEPTEQDRQRVSGTSSGDSGAGSTRTMVSLTKSQEAMARDLANSVGKGGMSQAEANVFWWKNVGSKAAAAKK